MATALTIAGSDSGGGAGIQADLKTFAALGVYGTSAVTAVTAQNTTGVRDVAMVPTSTIVAQIEAVLEDIGAGAIKTGMLGTPEVVEAVAGVLRPRGAGPLVVDPVMIAKSRDRLLSEEAVAVLIRNLLPLATVVTPNAPEAEALTGRPVRTEADAREAARQLHGLGPRAVIVKGGHLDTPDVVDVLFDGQEFHEARGPRHSTRHTHGTGCTFAAAIAAHLALGHGLPDAFHRSRAYLDGAIRHAPGVGHGAGPVDHFWALGLRPQAFGIRHSAFAGTGEPRRYTGMLLPFAISADPLDLAGVLTLAQQQHALQARRDDVEGPGAVVLFVGAVRGRHQGQEVQALTYEAYEPLAVGSFERISQEVTARVPGVVLCIHHRIGRLEVGDPSIVIAAVAAHRAEAYAASRFAIERVKQISPVWKREHLVDGAAWVEGATVHPDDPAPLEDAWRRACP
jgi:hydroxymethylpyrimidine kinase/phosphomethylpyrimidine kinase